MGGTVMGSHEAESVTDEFGRVHDTDNLYVSGPSLFPSSGAVNPTFTLTALAERQADHLLGIPLANPLISLAPARCFKLKVFVFV
jgi:choline dehydrogenase-like flavoprotein